MCIVSFWFKSHAFNLTLKVEREAGYSYSVQSLALTKLILVTKINAQNPPVHTNHLVVLQLVMQSVPTLIITIYQLVEEHPLKGHQLNFNTVIDIYVQLPSDEMGEGGVKIMFCSYNLKQGPAYKLLNSLLLLLPSIQRFNLTEA